MRYNTSTMKVRFLNNKFNLESFKIFEIILNKEKGEHGMVVKTRNSGQKSRQTEQLGLGKLGEA